MSLPDGISGTVDDPARSHGDSKCLTTDSRTIDSGTNRPIRLPDPLQKNSVETDFARRVQQIPCLIENSGREFQTHAAQGRPGPDSRSTNGQPRGDEAATASGGRHRKETYVIIHTPPGDRLLRTAAGFTLPALSATRVNVCS